MVDWDTHRIIDMIPSRESGEVSRWLSTYPNLSMISRDGAAGYASAGAKAHPAAIHCQGDGKKSHPLHGD